MKQWNAWSIYVRKDVPVLGLMIWSLARTRVRVASSLLAKDSNSRLSTLLHVRVESMEGVLDVSVCGNYLGFTLPFATSLISAKFPYAGNLNSYILFVVLQIFVVDLHNQCILLVENIIV